MSRRPDGVQFTDLCLARLAGQGRLIKPESVEGRQRLVGRLQSEGDSAE